MLYTHVPKACQKQKQCNMNSTTKINLVKITNYNKSENLMLFRTEKYIISWLKYFRSIISGLPPYNLLSHN